MNGARRPDAPEGSDSGPAGDEPDEDALVEAQLEQDPDAPGLAVAAEDESLEESLDPDTEEELERELGDVPEPGEPG